MHEIVGNMHMHTPYSDGEQYHRAIAEDAIAAGLDFIIVTDHNVWVGGIEQWVENEHGRVLLLTGEEVHDTRLHPQGNHMLVYGAETELSREARSPQGLIDAATAAGGLTFLAHPYEAGLPDADVLPNLGWHRWDMDGYTGLEIWNYMSSFANQVVRKLGPDSADTTWNRLRALPLALRPGHTVVGPEPAVLEKWDELLAQGKRVAGVGNSDAHATPFKLGPITREIYPYEHCFRAVNTHLQLEDPLTGVLDNDKPRILQAIGRGAGWIGYDLPRSTRGFRFSARGMERGTMGDTVRLEVGVTLQAVAPAPCTMRLIRHGEVLVSAEKSTGITHAANQPGAYRVECLIQYKGRERGWIYSNPIYVT